MYILMMIKIYIHNINSQVINNLIKAYKFMYVHIPTYVKDYVECVLSKFCCLDNVRGEIIIKKY